MSDVVRDTLYGGGRIPVGATRLAREFAEGASPTELAERYKTTVPEIEKVIRQVVLAKSLQRFEERARDPRVRRRLERRDRRFR